MDDQKPTLDYGKSSPSRDRLIADWKDWRLIPALLIALACAAYLHWRTNGVLGPG